MAGMGLLGWIVWAEVSGARRTNILVLGIDRRPHEGTLVRSDVMMVLTVYPARPQLGVLSIPRDLYVEIPGYGQNRINTAHFWGETESLGRGPRLAMQTVEQNFGVPIHRYIRLDFDGFRRIVDAVGGIDVIVEEPIVDDAYPTEDYGITRIEIPAGLQHMDGETALRYVRSRHGASDFERIERQQQVLLALAERLLAPDTWPRWPTVLLILLDNVDTDLGAGDWMRLAVTLQRVGPENVERRTIDRSMTDPWTTPSGGSVLLPRWDVIRPVIQELFTP